MFRYRIPKSTISKQLRHMTISFEGFVLWFEWLPLLLLIMYHAAGRPIWGLNPWRASIHVKLNSFNVRFRYYSTKMDNLSSIRLMRRWSLSKHCMFYFFFILFDTWSRPALTANELIVNWAINGLIVLFIAVYTVLLIELGSTHTFIKISESYY